VRDVEDSGAVAKVIWTNHGSREKEVIDVVVPALEERRKKLDQPPIPFIDRRYPPVPFEKACPRIWDKNKEGASQDN
jgi:hypothetical protein